MFEQVNYFLKITETCAEKENDWNNSQKKFDFSRKRLALLRQKTPLNIHLNDSADGAVPSHGAIRTVQTTVQQQATGSRFRRFSVLFYRQT